MDVNKLRKKHKRYSFLQTLCYLLGFPLLILLVFFGSTSMLYSDAFIKTRLYGLAAVIAIWVVFTILQIVVCIFSKNKNTRSLWSMLFAIILVIGGAFAFDLYAEKQIVAVQEKYETHKGVEIKDYNYQINYYETLTTDKSDLTDSYKAMVADFCAVYNVGVESKVYNKKINADGSPVVQDKKTKAYYSPNGMYADGYIFSMEEAIDILITINETRAKFAAKDKDADVELAAALATAKASSEWNTYKTTAEYKAAYGPSGTAYNHMLTMDNVDEILSVLGKHMDKLLDNVLVGILIDGLVPSDLKPLLDLLNANLDLATLCTTINNLNVGMILDIVEGIVSNIDPDLVDVVYDALLPIINYATDSVQTVTSLKAMSVLQLLNALEFDKLNEVTKALGMDLTDYAGVFTNGLTPDFVEELINTIPLTSNLFFYQSPTTKPIMDFIADEDMRAYAYAKYYATTHGSNVGSVLLGGSIGAVTFSSKGYPSAVFAYDLTKLYQLEAYNSYVPMYYPLFAARRYMYVCGGLILIMMALYYHNSRKKDEVFAQIAKGGKK